MQPYLSKYSAIKTLLKGLFVLVVLAILTTLCSCGTLKKNINKSKETEKIDTTIHTVTSTTTTTKLDTNIIIKPDTLTGEKNITEITKGDSLVTENGNIETVVKYDSASHKLKVKTIQKSKTIPVQFIQTTVKNTDEKKHIEDKKKSSEKIVVKERTGFELPWLWWLIVILFILLLLYKLRKAFI